MAAVTPWLWEEKEERGDRERGGGARIRLGAPDPPVINAFE
jgi:hypothetical protein